MAAVSQPTLPACAPRSGHETVLVAEDEAVLQELARMVLKRCGYHVLSARSAAMALSIWNQHAGEIEPRIAAERAVDVPRH